MHSLFEKLHYYFTPVHIVHTNINVSHTYKHSIRCKTAHIFICEDYAYSFTNNGNDLIMLNVIWILDNQMSIFYKSGFRVSGNQVVTVFLFFRLPCAVVTKCLRQPHNLSLTLVRGHSEITSSKFGQIFPPSPCQALMP